MKKTKFFAGNVLLFSVVLNSGCMTYDPYSGDKKVSNATKGAAIGAGVAALGAYAANRKDGSHNRNSRMLKSAAAAAAVGGGVGYYMDRQEAKLREQLNSTGVQVQRNGNELTLVMPSNITFQTNSSQLMPNFTQVLHSVALTLQEFKDTRIDISGHTDSSGSDSYNQLLSQQRAQAVANVLMSENIPASRLVVQGYGEAYPIADNNTEAGKATNRRVELKLIPNG